MTAPKTSATLETVITLAQLLERLERSKVAVAPDQYQVVVKRLAAALREAEPGEPLQAVLGAHPAAAELYENLQYEHAGLVRSPLEASLNAEMMAGAAILKAMRRSAGA
jgi:hypothetical protein